MEVWDVYDLDRALTGRTMARGSDFEPGAYHLVVHVCIFNSKGEMLIQQRQPFKKGWPNRWDVTVGGSAVAGDDSRSAAERETAEELGYALDLSGVRPHLSVNFDGGFDDFYLVEADVDLGALSLQSEEVRRVRWASRGEILAMIRSDEFIPYHESLIELLFDLRKCYSGLFADEAASNGGEVCGLK